MSQRGWRRQRAALFADAPRAPRRGRRRPTAVRRRGAPGLRRRAGEARAAAASAVAAAHGAANARRPKLRPGVRVPWLGIGVGVVIAALGFAALRTELVRLQYELGRVAAEESALREQLAESSANARSLRDPRRLRELAEQRGFQPAERVIDLRYRKRTP